MERSAMQPASERPADDHRHVGPAAVSEFREHVHNLVEGAGNEVGKLHLHDRSKPHQRGTGRPTYDRRFAYGGIDHPVFAELLEEPLRDLERPAIVPDVLSHQEHALVTLHLFPERLPDRFNIGDFHVASLQRAETGGL